MKVVTRISQTPFASRMSVWLIFLQLLMTAKLSFYLSLIQCTEKHLKEMFAKFGFVTDVKIPTKKGSSLEKRLAHSCANTC